MEISVEGSDGTGFDLLDLENAHSGNMENSKSDLKGDSSGPIVLDESDNAMKNDKINENEPANLDGESNRIAFDDFDNSYDAGAVSEVFDSGEFASDDLIEMSGPDEQSADRNFNSPDATVVDTDDIDDLLNAVIFDTKSADGDRAV